MEKNLAITQKIMILLTPEEFAEGMSLFLTKYQKVEKEPNLETEKMNRKEAANFLDVSYATMYNWTKEGILTQRGVGRKKFYLRSELISVLQNI